MSKKLNFGPMDEKCFISRSELLQWINNLLLVSVTRVEQLGCGSIYCQLFDVIYPGKIPLNKLKWKAKHEYEFSHNFKLLQKGFDSVSVAKVIPIEKLIKAKYQDNLEFAQWMKRFFEINCKDKGRGYDPKKKRGMAEPDLSFCVGGVLPQYTMIYGNFKDMDREIITKESENEAEKKPGSQPASGSPISNSANFDKENINSSNVLTNTKQSLKSYEPLLLKRMSLGERQNSLKDQKSGESDSDSTNCPFFMNNNQFNRLPHSIKFQASQSNKSLIKSLENKEEQFQNHSPSQSDSGMSEHMNSSAGLSGEKCGARDGSSIKLQQVKQLLSLFNVEDRKNTPDLFSLLTQIKSLVQ